MAKRVATQQRLMPPAVPAVPFPDKPSDRYANDWDNPNRKVDEARSARYFDMETLDYRQKARVIPRGNSGIVKRGR